MDSLYGVMSVVGPVLLAAVMVFAILSNRKKRSAADLAETEEGTRRLHEELDTEDKARERPKASTVAPGSYASKPGVTKTDSDLGQIARPNISTAHQPTGGARHPSDTLDRQLDRDPLSGGSIPSNYDPATSKRKGEGPTAADAEAARVARNGRA